MGNSAMSTRMTIIPNKLAPGGKIRIVAPSRSLSIIEERNRKLAIERLRSLGLTVSFGSHVEETDIFDSSSIQSRVSDLHEAFQDPSVSGILTVIGGHNCNQLLKYLDFKLIRKCPKPFCGYSDITAVANAIYAKTGLLTYSGPHFSSFGMLKGFDYSFEHFQKCLFSNDPFLVKVSDFWSDDAWYQDQEQREFIPGNGYLTLNQGEAEGTIIGGNLCTLNLLQGTEFMPSLANTIVFIEDDYESHPATFDRDLQSLIHQSNFDKVKGLVIGRFQKASQMTTEKLQFIIANKRELKSIPIIANANFGHTSPQFTFPIGGKARLRAVADEVRLEVTEH